MAQAARLVGEAGRLAQRAAAHPAGARRDRRPPAAPTPLRTIIFDEGVWDEDIYIAPKPDGTVIIGATKADVGFDTSVSAGGVQHLLDVAIKLLPALANCPVARMWACLRPKTPDSRPLLGPLPGWSNVTVASGRGGFGVTLSIVTGEAIAELVATEQFPEIIRPFAPQGTRGTHSNKLSDEESAALPFYRPAFSEQRVKDFAISVAIVVKDRVLTVEGFVEYSPP